MDLQKAIAQAAKKIKSVDEIQDLFKEITGPLIEKILEEELTHQLGYEKYSPKGKNSGNSRNGSHGKRVLSSHGELDIKVPRDRNGEFEPEIIKPYQNDITNFDQKIISMYARGMTTRDIQAHVSEIYGANISPTLVSMITEKVMEEAHQWQQRPLSSVYVAAFFDALFYKVREHGKIISKAVYTCIGINTHGRKEILGFWIASAEGASYWLNILNELKGRGVNDVFIASIDGLAGLADAIVAVYPATEVQRCVIHMIRSSLKYVPTKHRSEFIADLKPVYTALSEQEAAIALESFLTKWDDRYPLATRGWKDNWQHLSTFFKYPLELRKIIYTTNTVEALNRQLRKVTKNRSILANDNALFKILYLAARDILKKNNRIIHNWPVIATQLHLIYKERFLIEPHT